MSLVVGASSSTNTEATWPVPESWAWSRMGKIASVIGGGTPRTNVSANYEGGDIPWITPADLSGYTEKFISRGARNITSRGLASSSARMLPAGTVLFSSRAPIGYVAIAEQAVCTNQGFKSFVLAEGLDPSYVYYYLHRAREIARSMASGTTFLELSGAKAAEIPIPIPPLPEQRRIVAEIETQFTRLDAAVAALERARANLKRYRAAVIQAACTGALVKPESEIALSEGREFESATQLLSRAINGILPSSQIEFVSRSTSSHGLPNGWAMVPLSALLREPLRNGHSAKASASGDGIRTLTLTAVTNREFSMRNTKLTVAAASRVENLWLEPGDIFVERSNTPELVGTAALFQGDSRFAIFPDLLIRVRVVSGISPRYVELVLMTERSRRFFQQRAQGIAGSMPKIDQTTVSNVPIPLPPLAEQHRIVGEIDRQLSVVDALDSAIDAGLMRASRLRQSILRKAFAGELVSQDPEDEPATVLLERMRVERSAPSPAKKGNATSRKRIGKSSEIQHALL